MVGFAGVVIGLTVRELQFPLWGGVLSAFAVAIVVGYFNGLIVVKTRLPSFIVTLASLFILRGLSIGITRSVTGRTSIPYILKDVPDPWTATIFNGHILGGFFRWMGEQGWIEVRSDGMPFVPGIPMSIVWCIGVAIVAGWVLSNTRFGNWIYATGRRPRGGAQGGRAGRPGEDHPLHGTASAPRRCFADPGPGRRLRRHLRGALQGVRGDHRGGDRRRLLTGGYGSAIGAMFGALIFGIGPDRHLLYRHRHRLVLGLPRR